MTRVSQTMLALGLAVLAFGLAVRAAAPDGRANVVSTDVPLMLGLARDCVGSGACATRLSSLGVTSRLGVAHGAGYLDLLVAVDAAGGDVRHVAVTLAALFGLAAVVVFAFGARLGGPWLGAVGAGTFVLYAVWVQGFGVTWLVNAYLGPLPAALFVTAACVAATTRSAAMLLLATVAWAFGVQIHLAWAAGAVALGVLLVMAPRGHRSTRFAAMSLVALASVQALSPGALLDTQILDALTRTEPAQATAHEGAWIPFVVALALAAALLVVRRELARVAWRGRLAAFLLAGLLPMVLLLDLMGLTSAYYALPAAPAVAVMAVVALVGAREALAGAGAGRRPAAEASPPTRTGAWRAAGAGVVALALGVTLVGSAWVHAHATGLLGPGAPDLEAEAHDGAPTLPDFTYDDARIVADHLAGTLGYSFEGLYPHLRGLEAPGVLLAGLSLHLPTASGAPPEGDGRDVLVLKRRGPPCIQPLPAGWTALPTGGGELLVADYVPWLDWSGYESCSWSAGRPEGCRWRRVTNRFAPLAAQPDRTRLFARQFLGCDDGGDGAGDAQLVRVRVHVPAAGAPREVRLPAPIATAEPCVGQIVAAAGVEADLPAGSLVLRPDGVARDASLLLAWRAPGGRCWDGCESALPRPVLELDDAARAYLAACASNARLEPAPPAPAGHLPGPAEAARLVSAPAPEVAPRVARPVPPPEPLVPLWHVALAFGLHLVLLCVTAVAVARWRPAS